MPAVDGRTIRERAGRLRAAGECKVARHLVAQVGRAHRVLMESPVMGRTEQFAEVDFAEPRQEGVIVDAEISGATAERLCA